MMEVNGSRAFVSELRFIFHKSLCWRQLYVMLLTTNRLFINHDRIFLVLPDRCVNCASDIHASRSFPSSCLQISLWHFCDVHWTYLFEINFYNSAFLIIKGLLSVTEKFRTVCQIIIGQYPYIDRGVVGTSNTPTALLLLSRVVSILLISSMR